MCHRWEGKGGVWNTTISDVIFKHFLISDDDSSPLKTLSSSNICQVRTRIFMINIQFLRWEEPEDDEQTNNNNKLSIYDCVKFIERSWNKKNVFFCILVSTRTLCYESLSLVSQKFKPSLTTTTKKELRCQTNLIWYSTFAKVAPIIKFERRHNRYP